MAPTSRPAGTAERPVNEKYKGKVVLLDAGHGGLINGVYQTPGKRAYFKEGKLLSDKLSEKEREIQCDEKYYEGVGNRQIRAEVAKLLLKDGIEFLVVNPGQDDMSLQRRCDIVNEACAKYGTKNCLFISIHSDAVSNPKAHGASAYTSPGQTSSDPVATEWYERAADKWPGEKLRKSTGDGDPDKEAKFKVLMGTRCRAVLVENYFMTNYKDYTTHLKTAAGRQKVAEVIYETIKATL